MSFRASLSEASAGVLSLCLGAIGGVLGLIAVAVQAEWVSVPIGVAIGVFVALLIGYHNVRRARDAAESRLKELLEPRAELRYRAAQVRYGTLAAGDEYRHVVDVVNLSRRALAGCRLVLESSEPDEAHVTYPNSALGDRIGNKDGVFVLNPGNGDTPTFQVDVLQEFIPTHNLGSPAGPSEIRYLYADPAFNHAGKFFRSKEQKDVTMRLESSDLPTAVWLRLRVRYNDVAERFDVSVI